MVVQVDCLKCSYLYFHAALVLISLELYIFYDFKPVLTVAFLGSLSSAPSVNHSSFRIIEKIVVHFFFVDSEMSA